MKKLTLAIAAVGLLAVPPAATSGSATAPSQDATAEASGALMRIGGPRKLPARRKIAIPIRCSTVCRVAARPRLFIRGRRVPIRPRVIKLRLDPALGLQGVRITLNSPATRSLKRSIRRSRFKIRVDATDPVTRAKDDQIRIFKFKRG